MHYTIRRYNKLLTSFSVLTLNSAKQRGSRKLRTTIRDFLRNFHKLLSYKFYHRLFHQQRRSVCADFYCQPRTDKNIQKMPENWFIAFSLPDLKHLSLSINHFYSHVFNFQTIQVRNVSLSTISVTHNEKSLNTLSERKMFANKFLRAWQKVKKKNYFHICWWQNFLVCHVSSMLYTERSFQFHWKGRKTRASRKVIIKHIRFKVIDVLQDKAINKWCFYQQLHVPN